MVNQLKTGDRQGSTHSRSDVQPIIHLDIRKIPFLYNTDLGINRHIVDIVRTSSFSCMRRKAGWGWWAGQVRIGGVLE